MANSSDDFRAVIRNTAVDKNKTISTLFQELFDSKSVQEKDGKFIYFDNFQTALSSIKQIRQTFTRSDLLEIFEECNESLSGKVTIEELVDFCQRTISKARALSLKLRTAIMRDYAGEADYKKVFSTMLTNNSKYVGVEKFREFSEETLEINLSDSDGLGLFSLYDMDGDGKISQEDFLGFILGQAADAVKALDMGLPDAIVDIRISSGPIDDNELTEIGYKKIMPEQTPGQPINSADVYANSTFGKGQSLYIWRRSQGSCSGRLKPIIDLQLDVNNMSSAMVLSGYTCVTTKVAGQWLWIRRASNREEERDAIVELHVTVGRMRVPSDRIWSGPGVGWIRVEGNFSKALVSFTSLDSFLWFRPNRTRSLEAHLKSPTRAAVTLNDEERQSQVMAAVRLSVRHYVPLQQMKRVAALSLSASTTTRADLQYEYSALYHQYDTFGREKLNYSRLNQMLWDVGIRMDTADVNRCFHSFNIKQDSFISREEFASVLSLTDHELDLVVDKIRHKLLASSKAVQITESTSKAVDQAPNIGIVSPLAGNKDSKNRNKLRENRTLSDIFQILNLQKDKILGFDEIMDMTAKLQIFTTEEESRRIMKLMDIDGDDRVEESDFIAFMSKITSGKRDILVRKAQRVRECAAMLRRWLVRGTTQKSEASVTATDNQWYKFKIRHEGACGTRFPDYLSADDIALTVASLGVRLSPLEARELVFMIAPTKNGRIQQQDLHDFMARSCRSYGELVALLSRDCLKPLVDIYKKQLVSCKADGIEDVSLLEALNNRIQSSVKDIQSAVGANDVTQTAGTVTSNSANTSSGSHDVVSIMQLRAGIESSFKGFQTPLNQMPNVEEWCSLACLVGADVADENSNGVQAKIFLEGFCKISVEGLQAKSGDAADGLDNGKMSVDMMCRDLQRMIREEAKAAGRKGKLDYVAAFNLFDEDGHGSISLDEFKHMLIRLQLMDALPESQIPVLLKKFDRQSKGFITVEDFLCFVEAHKDMLSNEEEMAADDNDDIYDDITATSSSTPPPAAITRNADCDWLVWHLWKQCCKNEPGDPENLVSELQNACDEACSSLISTTMNSTNGLDTNVHITVKELWAILFEFKLIANMSKSQYQKGIQYLMLDSLKSAGGDSAELEWDHGEVDHAALCRYTVRMGRAFNALIQEKQKVDEKKYLELRNNLKKELMSLGSASEAATLPGAPVGLSRFEKVFRRLDSDGDGSITMQEFKLGLKRLRCKQEKAWSLNMIRRLYDEMDTNKDGTLSVKEFSYFIKDLSESAPQTASGPAAMEGNSQRQAQSSKTVTTHDDDDHDEFFGRTKVVNETDLFCKIFDILQDCAPSLESTTVMSSTRYSVNGLAVEAVQSVVRKFFSKFDPQGKGIVSEERFRAFMRRSGLTDRLTAAESRKMMEKIRRRNGTGDSFNTTSPNKSDGQVDYEKLCRQLELAVSASVPHSGLEGVLLRLEDAMIAAAAAGRPFLGLCSLADYKLSGFLSKDDLIHTFKMMGLIMSPSEFDVLKEILPCQPSGVFVGLYDYKELNHLVQQHTPRMDKPPPATEYHRGRNLRDSMASTEGGRRGGGYNSPQRLSRTALPPVSLFSPTGIQINTPGRVDGFDSGRSSNLYEPERADYGRSSSGRLQQTGSHDRGMALLVDRIKFAVEDRARGGSNYSLLRKFQTFDNNGSGWISMRAMQSSIVDGLSLPLSVSDLNTIQSLFGRPEDDSVDYESLHHRVFGTLASSSSTNNFGRNSVTYGHSDGIASGNSNNNNFNGNQIETSGQNATGVPSYTNARVIQRVKELRSMGQNPRDIFEPYDLDGTGIIDVRRFREVVQRLNLLQTEHQVSKAIEDFTCISSRSEFLYDDFCCTLEALVDRRGSNSNQTAGHRPSSATFGTRSMTERDHVVDGDGFDGMNPSRSYARFADTSSHAVTEKWYRESQSSPPPTFRGSYNDGGASPQQRPRSHGHRDVPVELDDGSESIYPPKFSETLPGYANTRTKWYDGTGASSRSNDFRDGNMSPPNTRRFGATASSTSSVRSSLPAPRASPSRVGSLMWGSDTPMAMKGKPPKVGDSMWCCRVCMYSENPNSAAQCGVCDSPNYNKLKDFQIKEQCMNCTFLNGQFAVECEMCGEPLSHAH